MRIQEIKGKMGSIENVAKLTKALETFSALKMRRAQKMVLRSRPFAGMIAKILVKSGPSLKSLSPFLREGKGEKILSCVIASNRGFCGSFNENILKFSLKEIAVMEKEKPVVVVPVGNKAVKFFQKRYRIGQSFPGVGDYWELEKVRPLADFVINSFLSGQCQKVILFYTDFVSVFLQKPSKLQILPLSEEKLKEFLKEEEKEKEAVGSEYLLEPSLEVILNKVLPQLVEYLIYQCVLEANISEHVSRMMAMRSASENAEDLLARSKLEYNKLRQELITNEVGEISSARQAIGA